MIIETTTIAVKYLMNAYRRKTGIIQSMQRECLKQSDATLEPLSCRTREPRRYYVSYSCVLELKSAAASYSELIPL